MGDVIDMTGRVLAEGETVTENREEQEQRAALYAVWADAPRAAREWAELHGFDYPDAVELLVHSLLTEAEEASAEHERAGQVLEFIRDRFFSGE